MPVIWLLIFAFFGCAQERNTQDIGQEEVDAQYCYACHGSEKSPAPPYDTKGHSSKEYRGVGSHESHVFAGKFSEPIKCETCHIVPKKADDLGHMDTKPPAEVVFSGIAIKKGSQPKVNAENDDDLTKVTCSNTYCHNQSGAKFPEVLWNGNTQEMTCESCHGFPPPAPHSNNKVCANCHANINPEGKIIDLSKHVNGSVEVAVQGCNSCHGSDDNPAPPPDTKGNQGTEHISVGAHQTHLKATLSKPLYCDQCHKVPSSVDEKGHIDEPPAEIVFGTLAGTMGAQPAWDHNTATCSGVYCHGATLKGGTVSAPKWTQVDGFQAKCGSCHGIPPPSPHPQSSQCETCHTDTVGVGQKIINPDNHIDGKVQVKVTGCNSCHGNEKNPAPPKNTKGEDSTSLVTIGAHQSHLLATHKLSSAVLCSECHVVPETVGAQGHIDQPPAEVLFGNLAKTESNPSWDSSAGKCTNVYCHGKNGWGGTNNSPTWTDVTGNQVACGACHGIPPNTGKHPSIFSKHKFMGNDCSNCHLETSDGKVIKDPTIHINGKKDVILKSAGKWDPVSKTCDPACHGSKKW